MPLFEHRFIQILKLKIISKINLWIYSFRDILLLRQMIIETITTKNEDLGNFTQRTFFKF